MDKKDTVIFYLSGALLAVQENIKKAGMISDSTFQGVENVLRVYIDSLPMDRITKEDYKKELGL